jgi:Amt family ammonium transporter
MVYGYDLMYGGGVMLEGINEVGKLTAEGSAKAYANPADFFFQVVFVATAMSIVSGAVAERMKLFSFFIFAIIFTTVIYPMEGAWTWGNGVAGSMGENGVFGLFALGDSILDPESGKVLVEGVAWKDFAGSGIVHMAGAAAALAGVIVLGARKGKYNKDGSSNAIPGANMPLATLGTFILWLGWFGFNGGSVLSMASQGSSIDVAMVFLNTNAAAAGGVIAAIILVKLLWGKVDLSMALNGALAGLVAITAAPDTPTALQATLIGAVGGVLVVFSITMLDRMFKIDDPVGAISVHGVAGLWGLLAVVITSPDTTIMGQLTGAATIFVWVFGTSLVLWLVLKAVMGIRVTEEEEDAGLDLTECGEQAYPEFTK